MPPSARLIHIHVEVVSKLAQMSAQTHHANPQILDLRTLQKNHRALAQMLRPGLVVLDVGCGTGAITSGIAPRVAPGGFALGLDRDESLLPIAREKCADVHGLAFFNGDIFSVTPEDLENNGYPDEFDIVSAARVLQWVSDPEAAVRRMKALTKPDGAIVVLDYDHTLNEWDPAPPAAFRRAYQAFLDWRDEHGWDNPMASNLPALCERVGLRDVHVSVESELIRRGSAGFEVSSLLWLNVLASVGDQLLQGGFLSGSELANAQETYLSWATSEMESQILHLRAVLARN